MLVAHVLYDMVKAGRMGPVEIGFISSISVAAKAGRMN